MIVDCASPQLPPPLPPVTFREKLWVALWVMACLFAAVSFFRTAPKVWIAPLPTPF